MGGSWSAGNTSQGPYALSVAKSGTGSGTITSSPAGINCGSTCSASFTGGASVALTATPASGSFFAGWSGDCSGAGSCVVTMSAAKNITATFKPVPFVANTTSTITATSATITTTITFNPTDKGKQGSVFVTSWAPANGLSTFGILTAGLSNAMSVTTTSDNPYLAGKVKSQQEALSTLLAATDSNAFVLVQLTTSGWQLVQNGQLIPYATGVLGDSLAAQNILNNANPTSLLGAQFCVGYGTSAAEMVTSGRMMPVATIPGTGLAATTNGSCNVALTPYMGLWWNPNESGWGMSITQHNNTIFAVPFTYDSAKQPTWYAMSNCPIVTAGSCTGDIYNVTGGTSPAAPWNGTGKVVGTAGTGTLTFTDANNGRFTYTLNGVSGSKTITRELFSNGTPQFGVDYTDLWWNPNESGWGIALTQDHGMIFAAWFAYDAGGKAIWYVASSCPLSSASTGNACTGDLYQVSGGSPLTATWSSNLSVPKVGTVTFAFSDANNALMSYTLNGVPSTRTISREGF